MKQNRKRKQIHFPDINTYTEGATMAISWAKRSSITCENKITITNNNISHLFIYIRRRNWIESKWESTWGWLKVGDVEEGETERRWESLSAIFCFHEYICLFCNIRSDQTSFKTLTIYVESLRKEKERGRMNVRKVYERRKSFCFDLIWGKGKTCLRCWRKDRWPYQKKGKV